MKKKKRMSLFCYVMTLAMVLVMMFEQTSCMTRKLLSEQVVVHDTLREFHTDTVRLGVHHSHVDTVRESRVQVVTLRQDSARTDTVRVETVLERWHTVFITDSVNTFRHLADSLQAVFKKQAVSEVSAPRRHTMGWVFVITLLSVVVVVGILLIVKRRKR